MRHNCAQSEAKADLIGPRYLVVGIRTSSRRIAYLRRAARPGTPRPGIVWLGGIKSHMRGVKAAHLDRYAAKAGRAFLRFDYSGHGLSEGDFESGTIGMWLEESLKAIRDLTRGPQILVGSSMGGWLALLAAKALHECGETERLMGLVLLAPAVDFTEVLIYEKLPPSARAELMENGVWFRPSANSQARNPITRLLIEEGRNHLLFGGAIQAPGPVHILQGMKDETVPWRHALTLVDKLASGPVNLTLIKCGDHRLARDEDLARLSSAVDAMA
ncbi:MAG: alpha/beta fold hydrolase [Beijerinckiaceae bacterium]|nr:alpha/beta fold hydrolase [Beijerinckiaceae bacterium]MCI0736115.1 alpha/beta fold hydrolase [Beijerinckiaceae bacterium]